MTSRRRGALCVPADEPAKVAKAARVEVDEIVVDLEDAVTPDRKDHARAQVGALVRRQQGAMAVRVNAVDTSWCQRDLVACVHNAAVTSVVIPKVDSAETVRAVEDALTVAETAAGRREPVSIQVLIESAQGLAAVQHIACASPRICSLILGYADLAVSLGRRSNAPWDFARDAVVLAARAHGVQPVDGPYLAVTDDQELLASAVRAAGAGFDGKWIIHPRQVVTVQGAFVPGQDQIDEATEILAVLDAAAQRGFGAVAWRGKMLDEALAAQARRVLALAAP